MKEPVIFVTGAGKGIGRAIVQDLASRPHWRPRLFLFSRTALDLESLKKECASKCAAIEFFPGDLAKSGDVAGAVGHCLKKFGRIDFLVNNAGVGRFGALEDFTEEDIDYVFDTNLKGTFLVTQKVFEIMKRQGSGHLLFVTSISAENPFPHSAIYCMSKFGQKGLIEVMRLLAYPLGIRVTHVMPGATHTPMWGETTPKQQAKMMPAPEVARAIVDCMEARAGTTIEELVIRPQFGDYFGDETGESV